MSAGVDTGVEPVGGAASGTATADPWYPVVLDLLGAVLGGEVDAGPGSNLFEDLGADSMTMARFCARLRKHEGLPSLSMRDVYADPTPAGLVLRLRALAPAPAPTGPDGRDTAAAPRLSDQPAPAARPAPPYRRVVAVRPARLGPGGPGDGPAPYLAGRGRVALCGLVQLLCFAGYAALGVLAMAPGFAWVAEAGGPVGGYLRAVVVGSAALLVAALVPIVAKWVLIGRWRATRIPLWGAGYLRFWIVKSLLHTSPAVLLAGNPLYVLYLRALGARIGRNVLVLTRTVPVCTDLLTIGDDTVVRKDALLLGYHGHQGRIVTGAVRIGAGCLVGEKGVLDVDTELGDGAQLGHASSLHPGDRVPAGQVWHGSPAEPATVDYQRAPRLPERRGRRVGFGLAGLLQLLLVVMPASVGGGTLVVGLLPGLRPLLEPASGDRLGADLVGELALVSLVGFAGVLTAALALMVVVPRVVARVVRPGRAYPLYGLHYSLHRSTQALTNRKFFTWLLGDSSFIVPYLRALGYRLTHVEQTGSNFGTEIQHESPSWITVGRGTMVADGLSVVNADFSSTAFTVSHTEIGGHSFLGNNIVYPSGGRTGENVLIATKAMVPLDGPVRSGVGLLGSPSFEIPRTVERDTRFDAWRSGEELRRRLAGKNRYNLRSMALMLAARWLQLYGLLLLGAVGVALPGTVGLIVLVAFPVLAVVLTVGYWICVERVLLRFGRLAPQLRSIYDPYFWWHERLWKVPDRHLAVLNGTPYRPWVWRALGARVGRCVFDDGVYLTERTLTTIGDHATLNPLSKLQAHSQEDGTFKSDHIVVGAGATLGVAAFVHYGTDLGPGAELAPDSFLMKGEQVPAGGRWAGNPAAETRERR